MDKKFNEFITEAKASVKTGRAGHYGAAAGLHKFVGSGSAHDVHAHLAAVTKKHGYTSHTVEHGVSDKHREQAAYSMGPAQHHEKHTLTHPDGHSEHVYVSHHNGKVTRIGHTSSTAVGHHDIHVHGKTLAYRDGVKKHTIHHTANGMHYEYHDK